MPTRGGDVMSGGCGTLFASACDMLRGMWQGATVVFAMVACGGCRTAPPASDAAVVDDGSGVDADTRACANVGDCPCFTNHDCPPTHACVSQDPSGASVSCVTGPRGTGASGMPCTGEHDCTSALCVEDAAGGQRCSDVCTSPATCPPELPRCVLLGGVGICARAP